MDNYKELCENKIKTMDIDSYNHFCSLIIKARSGEISWQALWENHLKDSHKRNRVSLHG